MYDFHKVRQSVGEDIFKHPLFVEHRPELLKDIRRKTTPASWPVVTSNTLNKPDLAPFLQKLMDLHILNQESEHMIQNLQEKVQDLTNQKEVLSMQFWETQERLKQIEKTCMILANCMQIGGQEILKHIQKDRPNKMKSIEKYQKPTKKQKIDHLSIEELLDFPREDYQEVELPKMIENHTEFFEFAPEEHLEFLLES